MRAFIGWEALEELLKSIVVATNKAFGHIEKETTSKDASTVKVTAVLATLSWGKALVGCNDSSLVSTPVLVVSLFGGNVIVSFLP